MNSTAERPNSRGRGLKCEQQACAYLEGRGLTLCVRNYRAPFGEIDLIMQDRDTLVFVEVRARRSTRFGAPAETVDARKQGRLRAAAEHFLQRQKHAADRACRFDVVAITGNAGEESIQWLQNAF